MTGSHTNAIGDDPRIGVYVCHCGTNISQTVDVAAVAKYAAKLPGVVVAREYKYTCSEPGQEMIRQDIRGLGLNRVVVTACSPLMHEPTFRRTCAAAGLNPFLFQMANIREHCSWVHDDKELATEKARKIVAGAVARVAQHVPLETKRVPVNPAVLVVGGGIAGIEAALQIADGGKQVYLVEREPSIGGHMAKFDKTFPTLDCAACILTPKMVSVGQHPNIRTFSYSEVTEVAGYVGNFRVKVKRKARYVDEKECTGCGLCIEKCPWKAPDEFNEGLSQRKAIYRPFQQAVPNIPVIDKAACRYFKTGKCKVCQRFCPRDAIRFDQQDEIVDLEVGSIILATGFKSFDANRVSGEYGYGRLDNVITALEFERLSHASGPTGGEIVLKNGEHPKSVAILHCIGSRDVNTNEHCSRVCCMYSLKMAHLVKEHTHAKVYEYYIDMRAFGKGYEEFYKRLMEEDVIFIRGKAAEVRPALPVNGKPGGLVVRAEDTLLGQVRETKVDMVILSTGLEAQSDSADIARVFGISCSKGGFFLERHPKLAPVNTASDGVFIAGACQGPKDIPDSVAQGAAAAAGALSLISRGEVEIEPIVSVIDEATCSGCQVCVQLCPYSAITPDLVNRVARIEAAQCKGCGVCVAACPTGAAQQQGFTDRQIEAEIDAVLSAR
jgi:heterodisulfide reductase subunit A2